MIWAHELSKLSFERESSPNVPTLKVLSNVMSP